MFVIFIFWFACTPFPLSPFPFFRRGVSGINYLLIILKEENKTKNQKPDNQEADSNEKAMKDQIGLRLYINNEVEEGKKGEK